jgi:NAD(P)-dependent dehydrogenase (short-subunit alcohol dehydrogenase family)
MTDRLKGKVAFLAGATSGIGETTAEVFAREGARVAIAGRRVAEGEAIAARIRSAGGDAIFLATDVTIPDSVASSIRAAVTAFGALHVLFNNAGGSTPRDGTVIASPDEEYWRANRLDSYGTWNCCKYGIPEIVKSGGGSVINMASMAGVSGSGGRNAYSAAKGSVLGLSKAMARDFVGQKIRVNVLAPAAVATARIRMLLDTVPGARETVSRQVLGLIDPMELAWAAVYLASDESRTLTGQTLAIHAGAFDS